MVFDKPSTRTRVSFDVAMRELGGETLMLTGQEMQLGRGETIADTARVLSRYVDAIMIRILDHAMMLELAEHATVPVINGLTKTSPSLPDHGRRDDLRGASRADRGPHGRLDGRRQQRLRLLGPRRGAARLRLAVATPPELDPRPELVAWAKREGAGIVGHARPVRGRRRRRRVVTDCWVSMGDEDEGRRHNLLKPYQVNDRLMAAGKPDAIFMHCLPAHRGEEVTDEVMDGPQSVVFDEAENRLHAQKGILAWCLGAVEA